MSWTSLFAPKGTPPAVVERINVAIKAALADPALRERLNQAGVLLPDETGPVFFEKSLRHEMTKWGDCALAAELKSPTRLRALTVGLGT